jgi:DNA-binding response OmpR family regulator
MRILIVEDDSAIAAALVDYLVARGHTADWAASAAQALARLEENTFDAMVLDRGLPRMEGLRFLRLLREDMSIDLPVLVLTARDTEADKLEGFHAGADDYVIKPFSLAEIEARLLALCRRTQATRGPAEKVLQVAGLRFDLDRYELAVAGEVRSAGPKVLLLVETLMREPGRVFTHEALEQVLWGDIQDGGDKLRQILYQARKLIVSDSSGCEIVTVHGRGLRLELRL